jgi:hypothetical protein
MIKIISVSYRTTSTISTLFIRSNRIKAVDYAFSLFVQTSNNAEYIVWEEAFIIKSSEKHVGDGRSGNWLFMLVLVQLD